MAGAVQPNFVFLFPDQLRPDYLGCAGSVPVRTPHVDALAARGTRFTQCRCNSPICSPSRAALATGRRYERCGVPSNQYNTDPALGTVFQRLRDAGYRIGSCGKSDLAKAAPERGEGWTALMGRYGFTEAVDQAGKLDCVNQGGERPRDPYAAHLHERGLMAAHRRDYHERGRVGDPAAWATPLPRRDYTDDFAGARALDLIDGFPAGAPWMLWVNFPGPHSPFDAPKELLDRYADATFPEPAGEAPKDPAAVQAVRRNYAACVEGIDEWVGRIVDAVAQRGELERTVFVFASDHGEMLGDHGRWGKGRPEEPSVGVPLVMAGPGIRRGATSDALVELIDVSATLLELAGLETPADWDARSFAPILRGGASAHRDVQHSALADWRMVCDGRYKLVERKGEIEALYDLERDPWETSDHAADNPEAMDRLRAHLRETSG